jgi:serine protease Do
MSANEPPPATGTHQESKKARVAAVVAIFGTIAAILGGLLNVAGVLDLFGEIRERWREERLAVSSVGEARSATIEIEGLSSSNSWSEEHRLELGFLSSGFIIDPSGIAVTTNEGLADAALIRVRFAGEETELNATILGRSECSNLGVIDVDGEGHPYFRWREEDTHTGLDVHAAGFGTRPGASAETENSFFLSHGTVMHAGHHFDFAPGSVATVIKHSAAVYAGASGGPLIDDGGKVVGLHFAFEPGAERAYALPSAEVLEILDRLKAGHDVAYTGIIGYAVGPAEEPGILVNGVAPGSPADKVGLQSGDIVTQLQGIPVGEGGTMTDYCDILRSYSPGEVLSIQVKRPGTRDVLEGQLNGRQLEVVDDS